MQGVKLDRTGLCFLWHAAGCIIWKSCTAQPCYFCSLMMEGHFLTAGQTCILVCIATLPPEAVFSSLLLVRGLGLS